MSRRPTRRIKRQPNTSDARSNINNESITRAEESPSLIMPTSLRSLRRPNRRTTTTPTSTAPTPLVSIKRPTNIPKPIPIQKARDMVRRVRPASKLKRARHQQRQRIKTPTKSKITTTLPTKDVPSIERKTVSILDLPTDVPMLDLSTNEYTIEIPTSPPLEGLIITPKPFEYPLITISDEPKSIYSQRRKKFKYDIDRVSTRRSTGVKGSYPKISSDPQIPSLVSIAKEYNLPSSGSK